MRGNDGLHADWHCNGESVKRKNNEKADNKGGRSVEGSSSGKTLKSHRRVN